MKLEGYLQKYTNVYKGYQNRYFVLEDQQFSYYKEKVKFQNKGDKPTEILILKKVHIKHSSKNEKKFKLQINGELFRLEAESINQKQLWIDAITKNSLQISEKKITNQIIKKESIQEQNFYFSIETSNQALQMINPFIKDVWKNIQTLEQEYSSLVLKIQKKTSKLDDELVNLEAIILSQRRLFYALVKCNLFILAMDNFQDNESYKSFENEIDYDEFKSLQDHSDQHINLKHLQKEDFLKKPSRRTVTKRQSEGGEQFNDNTSSEDLQSGNRKYSSSLEQNEELSEKSIIKKKKSLKVQAETFEKKKFTCQIKQRLLQENEVFKLFEISDQSRRTCKFFKQGLPVKKDPNIKVNIWQILKDSIGKDITSFSVPIILNEPISMLQRLGEQCEYYDLLNQADKEENSQMRMAYVMAFTFSCLGGVINRTTKPFNPLLGETWEFLGDDIKILAEQVSHHPPISAVYAENQHFTYQANSNVKTKFWGKSLEILQQGFKFVNLLKHKDEFIIGQPKSCVYNIILGKVYVDFYGVINQNQDVTYQNKTTGEKGVFTLKQRSWGDKHAYEGEGYIQDKQGNKKLLLEGKWNSHLNVINNQTQESQQIWKRKPVIEANIDYYNFTDFAMNLNHLNQDLLEKIPATDSRLRPDQRGLEISNIPIAQNYKKILEQKQRDRREEYKKLDKVHVPKWFKITTNEQKETEFIYQGGYWEARETGQFGEILDLY